MANWVIPTKTVVPLKEGMTGIAVWSLQHALGDQGADIVLDGVFGPATTTAVKAFQKARKLSVIDGIAGPATMHALADYIIQITETRNATPPELLAGYAEGEGQWLLDAVNYMTLGGVDCGLFQRRVFAPDYRNDAVIERAFNTMYQADLVAKSLINLRGIFIARAGVNDGYGMGAKEKAWRLAALNHNYPTGADRLSRTPIKSLDPYWTTPQDWVMYDIRPDGTKVARNWHFPDGRLVRTPLEWCHMYAGVLGAGVYGTGGSVTRFTSVWP